MGMWISFLDYCFEKGLLRGYSRVLDIGPQNLYFATPSAVMRLISQLGSKGDERILAEAADRLSYFSTPRSGERTAFIAELFDLTTVSYLGYDVCPAPDTEIFDLNVQRLPADKMNYFDVVLNFGTTEHLLNQLNVFELMHHAVKVGGAILHQIPSVGWVDHGYFNYNALLIDDLVKANDYEVLDRFYTVAGESKFASKGLDIRDPATPNLMHSAKGPDFVPNFNLNYFVRKTVDAPFYVGLEIETTHSPLSEEIALAYGDRRRVAAGDLVRRHVMEPNSTGIENWMAAQ